MTLYQTIGMASEQVLHLLAAGCHIETGGITGSAIDRYILAAEEADFHWDARLTERCLGAYLSANDDEIALDRVAIIGRIDGRWFAATSIIDGDGMPQGMTHRRTFYTRQETERAFEHARGWQDFDRKGAASGWRCFSLSMGERENEAVEGGEKGWQGKSSASCVGREWRLHVVFGGGIRKACLHRCCASRFSASADGGP